MNISSKQYIKIPQEISVERVSNKLIFKGPMGTDMLLLRIRVQLTTDVVVVTSELLDGFDSSNFLNSKAVRNTTISLIKQIFVGLISGFRKNLQLVGVGYRGFIQKKSNLDVLQLKLGFSHLCEIEIPSQLKVVCVKPTLISIFGCNKQTVSNFAAFVRSHKFPEPYKGKGILYAGEKIKIKKGKKA